MATVRQSGGDYTTLNGACAAAETTINIDQSWTVNDTTKVTISTTGTTITVSGAAKHPGYWNTASNHYRLVCSGGHCITLNGNYTATLDGITVEQTGTGSSDECFRCVPGTAHTATIKNGIFWCLNNTNQQDCIYTGFNTSIGIVSVQNTILYNANRAGVHIQNAHSSTNSGTIRINSCTLWRNGRGGSAADGVRGGGVYIGKTAGANRTGITINVHNTIAIGNTTGNAGAQDYNDDDRATNPPTWNVSYSVDSDGSIATDTDGGTGNLASRTATDSSSPGAGNWVVFEDITSSPYDLRLKTNAENDAQDAHAVATAHGLTIPGTDIIGTARPQNTNYDIGAFEIAAAGATTVTITTGIDALVQKTGIVQTFSIDSVIQDTFSESVNIGALLAAVKTGQVSADAVLQALKSQDVSIDSLLQATKSGQVSADALLLASLQSTTDIDAILTSIFSTTTGIDALLQSLLTQTVSIDSLLQTGFLSTTDIDSLLQVTRTETASLGALLQAGISANVSLDAILSGASTASIQVDSLLQVLALSVSTSIDSYLQTSGTSSLSLDAVLTSVGGEERIIPDTIITQTAITGALSTIQDDPDSPDANWMLADSTASNPVLRVGFESPSLDLATGIDQEFRVLIRRTGVSGSGTPNYTVGLRITGGGADLVQTTGTLTVDSLVVSLLWDAATYPGVNADGSNVECYITGTSHGGGPNQRTIDIGAVEWNAQTAAQETISITSLDSLLQSGKSISTQIDAALQVLGLETTSSIDGIVQKQQSVNLLIGALLQAARTGLISIDAVLQATKTGATSLDAVLVAQGVSTESVSIDALLQDGFTNTASLDALLQDAFLSTAVLDAILQATRTGTVSIDAVLVSAGEVLATTSLDSLIQALVENTVSIDSLLQSPQVASINLDAVLFLLGNEQISIDSLLQIANVTSVLSIDSLIQALQSESVSIGALVAAQMSAGTSIDAILGFMASASTNFDSILKATRTQGVSLSAILGQIADLIIDSGRVVSVSAQSRYVTIAPKDRYITIH